MGGSPAVGVEHHAVGLREQAAFLRFLQTTTHVLQHYDKSDCVPRGRDFVAWRLLAASGIDADGFKMSVLDHGGDLLLMSLMVKSAQHVLAGAGLPDL